MRGATRRTALLLAACLAAAPQAAAQGNDWCGCAGSPESLGSFDAADPATWPTVDGRPTRVDSFVMTIPLPADGVLIFDEFRVESDASLNRIVFDGPPGANPPVQLLVAGDVSLRAGTLDLSGADGELGNLTALRRGGLGGPGGFRGGDAGNPILLGAEGARGGDGFGPGGGFAGPVGPAGVGENGSWVGSESLLPLVGGSGGGGGSTTSSNPGTNVRGGGGGGGALLIAANGTITVVGGRIDASGGDASIGSGAPGGAGSGGAIRLVAERVVVDRLRIDVQGGSGGSTFARAESGRLQVETPPGGLQIFNAFPSTMPRVVVPPGPVRSPLDPRVRITALDGAPLPAELEGYRGSSAAADVVVETPGLHAVEVETTGVPGGTGVDVRVVPHAGAPAATSTAILASCDPDGTCRATADVDLPAPGGYAIEAEATFQVP